MKNTVIIKGNKYGITIVLDSEVAFEQLVQDLSQKLVNAESFFDSDKQLAVSFEGRELTNKEMDELLYTITNTSKLNIQYVMDHNDDVEATFFDIIQTAQSLAKEEAPLPDDIDIIDWDEPAIAISEKTEFDNPGLFYKGTLRSGQSIEAKDSIVVIGDVNPGATITANGNVVIIGSLKGSVIAGQSGNENAFVMALSMHPMKIQIADIVAKNVESKKSFRSKREDAMIASIINNQIVIERVSKTSIQDVNI